MFLIFSMFSMFSILLIFVVFYFLLIRPQQKKQKAHREMIGAVRRGDLRLERGAFIVVEAADNALVKGVQDIERHPLTPA